MAYVTKTDLERSTRQILMTIWGVAIPGFLVCALLVGIILASFLNADQVSGIFPLKEPVYTHGKILCTSWYSKLRTEIIKGKQVTYEYKALNYPAKFGTDIQASWDGTVIDTLIDGYEGATVTILYDNGLTVRYCHLSKQMVLDGPNSRVKQGTIIGKVGRSGRTTGSHVRIVVEKNGERVFCNAETWGMKYTDFHYSKTNFDSDNTTLYAQNK